MPRTNVNKTETKYRRFNDFVRGEMKRRRQNLGMLADYLNMSRSSLSLRLLGQVEWTFKEFLETLEYLEVDISEIF